MRTKKTNSAKHRKSETVAPTANGKVQPQEAPRPHWDCLTRTLFLGGEVIKRFGRPAPNVELLLSAFEKKRWPFRIADPLPRIRGVYGKRRLHETIQNLNRRLGSRHLIFRGDGTGAGIVWQLAGV